MTLFYFYALLYVCDYEITATPPYCNTPLLHYKKPYCNTPLLLHPLTATLFTATPAYCNTSLLQHPFNLLHCNTPLHEHPLTATLPYCNNPLPQHPQTVIYSHEINRIHDQISLSMTNLKIAYSFSNYRHIHILEKWKYQKNILNLSYYTTLLYTKSKEFIFLSLCK